MAATVDGQLDVLQLDIEEQILAVAEPSLDKSHSLLEALGRVKTARGVTLSGTVNAGLTQAQTTAAFDATQVTGAVGTGADAAGANTALGQLKQIVANTGGGGAAPDSGPGPATAATSRVVAATDSPEVVAVASLDTTLGDGGDVAGANTGIGQLKQIAANTAGAAGSTGAGAVDANTARTVTATDSPEVVAITALDTAVGDGADVAGANTAIGQLKQIATNTAGAAGTTGAGAVDANTARTVTATDSPEITLLTSLDGRATNAGATDTTTTRVVAASDSPEVVTGAAINTAIGATTDPSTADTVIGLLKRLIDDNDFTTSAFTATTAETISGQNIAIGDTLFRSGNEAGAEIWTVNGVVLATPPTDPELANGVASPGATSVVAPVQTLTNIGDRITIDATALNGKRAYWFGFSITGMGPGDTLSLRVETSSAAGSTRYLALAGGDLVYSGNAGNVDDSVWDDSNNAAVYHVELITNSAAGVAQVAIEGRVEVGS